MVPGAALHPGRPWGVGRRLISTSPPSGLHPAFEGTRGALQRGGRCGIPRTGRSIRMRRGCACMGRLRPSAVHSPKRPVPGHDSRPPRRCCLERLRFVSGAMLPRASEHGEGEGGVQQGSLCFPESQTGAGRGRGFTSTHARTHVKYCNRKARSRYPISLFGTVVLLVAVNGGSAPTSFSFDMYQYSLHLHYRIHCFLRLEGYV